MNWALLHQSLKEMLHRLVWSLILQKHFLIRGTHLANDSNLYQVALKLASILTVPFLLCCHHIPDLPLQLLITLPPHPCP